LELLKTVAPNIAQLTVLVNPTNPNASEQLKETEAAALSMGVRLKLLRVPSTAELDKAFSGTGRSPATALFISSDALLIAERRHIADIALAKRMPAMGFAREFAEDGILISYGASLPAMQHRAATYVDKILKGAKPADLPVEQPTKFELVINLKTVKALGLTIRRRFWGARTRSSSEPQRFLGQHHPQPRRAARTPNLRHARALQVECTFLKG
jgi:putative ABC transport system substrate-binding protein